MKEGDPFNLNRFVKAQREEKCVPLDEIRRGKKTSHWMWWEFPQVLLGNSERSKKYAIHSLDEARAYLAHPVLGKRLGLLAQAMLDLNGRSAEDILDSTDASKLKSSATLFSLVSPPGSVFHGLLARFYHGELDARTMELMQPVDSGPARSTS
ncbi:MAG: hypothetical protein JWO05_923 [Gemmatimonadetes bacterium]|nr:hypothetical protein [Gemmatimonadota bacterium]